jgi:two-component system sensor histidine kinase HydH
MPGFGMQDRKGDSAQLIFLGLDRSPFTSARNKDRSTTVLVAGLLLLLGVAGFLALFWALDLKTSRRMLMDARALAEDLKEQVRRTEKLAAVGSLAAGVAHEIRNPLSSIKGLATYFGSKFDSDSEEKRLAQVMVQETDRLNRVITELLEFARPSMPNLESVHLKDLVGHSLRLVRQDAASSGVKISSRIPNSLPRLDLDQDRVLQVLINLYLNAIQAMPRGGTLSVSAARKKDKTLLHVADTGAGISEEDLAKIFDPYFTTKNSGTGLGLATVHKIMESHGGTVEVSSTVGRGTTFTLTFPHKE